MHELAYGATSYNAGFGPVRNAVDPRRSPGGSPGGTAAAVAADIAPAGLGSSTRGTEWGCGLSSDNAALPAGRRGTDRPHIRQRGSDGAQHRGSGCSGRGHERNSTAAAACCAGTALRRRATAFGQCFAVRRGCARSLPETPADRQRPTASATGLCYEIRAWF